MASILRLLDPTLVLTLFRRMAVTECQGCGAWNDASRAFCVLCGAPLAEIDEWDPAAEPPPLPPLPDGGLRASMPAWLREPPPAASASSPRQAAADPPRVEPPLGPHADPRAFLSDDDFPQWLRDLASRRLATERGPSRVAEEPPPPPPAAPAAAAGPPTRAEVAVVMAAVDPAPAPADLSPMPAEPPMPAAPQAPADDPAPDASEAAIAAPDSLPAAASWPREERRRREPWETLLLTALGIGVIAAALWALIANGVFGPGP